MTTNPNIIKDPNLVDERIFVGNLPVKTTREELESICVRYGNVLTSMVQKNFGFVQFDSEETANKAASALNGSTFKGNRITVRNAGIKLKKANQESSSQNTQQSQESMAKLHQQYLASISNPDYNDCEIIVVNKQNTEYAEFIEQRLRQLHLKVDLLFPNEEVPIGKVLANISSRGCLYAVLVTPQNQEHRSITVNILYGQPAEHRNMPVEDAINLISTDFQQKLKTVKPKAVPMAVPIIPPVNSVAPPLKERHPESIQNLLNLLADNLPLTVLQYDRIIKYLNERRELQVMAELGDIADAPPPPLANTKLQPPKPPVPPDPEIELQKKIFNILNKTPITNTKVNLVYPNVESLKNDNELIKLLKDTKVQLALNSLLKTSLVSTIEDHFKF